MKKQILKRAACVVILTGIVIGAIYGWKYYENEQRKKQSAYFTEDRLTANEMWIMDNPKKAVNIMKFMAGGAWRYHRLGDWVYPTYEKLTGETEDMSESTEDSPPNNL